jgi:ubiquinone/menaquinone biosynthesis C-methylase UbiE
VGADVLEVACGTGYWTEVLIRSAATVLATDINEEMLSLARSRDIDPQRIVFQRADAYAANIFPPIHCWAVGFLVVAYAEV